MRGAERTLPAWQIKITIFRCFVLIPVCGRADPAVLTGRFVMSLLYANYGALVLDNDNDFIIYIGQI